ncbi:DNA ligase B [Tepidimonas sediminis]|uniref:DNA ligase (ATP) n=1 Tax=Tepidimonas sediminis TaxID=2588941 RepID=A0A554WL69_9BURK|nr:ATP-dependent DNA ligase [Tepidimonas sediminis]TSE24309.1 DNA ligase B [Tepidimonas sediminis]
MNDFAALCAALDATTSTQARLQALQTYFAQADAADAAWAVYLLAGGKPRQAVPTREFKALAREVAGLPEWLFDECHQAVGDLAETVALLLPPPAQPLQQPLAAWMAQVRALRGLPPDERAARLKAQWARLPQEQRLLHGKLITGALRVGVSRLLVTQALAALAGVPPALVAQRLIGYTHADASPGPDDWRALVAPAAPAPVGPAAGVPDAHPYPFFLAHALPADAQAAAAQLGAVPDWLVEWKWDGIRAQLVRRGGVALWSRGEELITERFPELAELGARLPPGTVLDGEIVVWRDGAPQPFAALQRRLGRQRVGAALRRALPVALLAYDLLEQDGADLRTRPQHERRARLQALVQAVADARLLLSPELIAPPGADWAWFDGERRRARTVGAEGLMLKRRDGVYGVGRTRRDGLWWKWKADPWTVDAVLVYAQRGHGRRAGLFSDYTFALWSHPPGDARRQLVPFAKAYSGLSDAELARVDAIIRRTTRDSFGPVRAVEPTLVFELGFEGLARSARHKSGVAVRFPRILRWRTDKPVEEADTLAALHALLDGAAGGGAGEAG